MNDLRGQRVAVGMSGGVDSTVAALLLQRAGAEVIGLTMRLHGAAANLPPDIRAGCFGPGGDRAIADAQASARRLGIRHEVIDLTSAFAKNVLDYFRAEYCAGRTPNPCARCNRMVKFGALLDGARAAGIPFDRFATGHYVRLVTGADGAPRLARAVYAAKDQSYFLALIPRTLLPRLIFPLGSLVKDEVRALAREAGLAEAADRAESQDFLPSDDFPMLFGEGQNQPGPILDERGVELGRHDGLIRYTVGQRKGLRIGGLLQPLYVLRLDPAANAVIVGPKDGLYTRSFAVSELNWLDAPVPPTEPRRVEARIRQQHQPAPATLTVSADGRADVEFDQPQLSITPGQLAAFYDGEILLGGGTIEHPHSPREVS